MDLKSLEKAVSASRWLMVVLLILLPLIYFLWFYLINSQSLSVDPSIWGAFGDYVGGILNPIVALFAFYWLTKSVLIQKEELHETRKALEESSASQKEQAESAKISSEIQTINIKLAMINTKLSAKYDYKTSVMTNGMSGGHFNLVLTHEGHAANVREVLGTLNDEIRNLEAVQEKLLHEVDILIKKHNKVL
ncbi:hypothetical protein AYI92_07895 [Shewanella xiamenensis]|uniref:hypothetical protein n=1 Tax=Shewanella TaxID=22 RepID=UPI0011864379|nr:MULTISPECIES: hypothetical protein [Shewanella]TVL23713.1 hypothetical protein AYI90_01945 [Shewanella xiamenensis]TVL24277.1 hypothetical protein AYI91_01945 [Shewanella xiamenensis]TVL26829.1 hypothetical protein AYI92_07895 [Shewanella xiamenensis]TVL37697.1 hypothetical protein AYI93_02110 [Shewanella xiamenensis]TVP05244.1 hypothetical protein AYI89_02170 [Shewanella xiamenensis]